MASFSLFMPFFVLMALQLIINQASAADAFGQFEDHLNEQQTVTGGSNRDIRSLANGRWQLRPGKRTSLTEFAPFDALMDEGPPRGRARRMRNIYALLPPLNNWN